MGNRIEDFFELFNMDDADASIMDLIFDMNTISEGDYVRINFNYLYDASGVIPKGTIVKVVKKHADRLIFEYSPKENVNFNFILLIGLHSFTKTLPLKK